MVTTKVDTPPSTTILPPPSTVAQVVLSTPQALPGFPSPPPPPVSMPFFDGSTTMSWPTTMPSLPIGCNYCRYRLRLVRSTRILAVSTTHHPCTRSSRFMVRAVGPSLRHIMLMALLGMLRGFPQCIDAPVASRPLWIAYVAVSSCVP